MGPIITATITASERLGNSVNGNPRYRVAFDDGEIRISSSDSSWVYSFGNPGLRNGDKVIITLTAAGRISHMEPASK